MIESKSQLAVGAEICWSAMIPGKVGRDPEDKTGEEPGECLLHWETESLQVLSSHPGEDLLSPAGQVQEPPDQRAQGPVQGGQGSNTGAAHWVTLYQGNIFISYSFAACLY